MIFKLFVLTFIYLLGFTVLSSAKNITSTQEQKIANEVTIVIAEILKEEINYRKLNNKISKYKKKIIQNKISIEDMNNNKNLLEKEFLDLQEKQNIIESNIITLTVKKYSKSMAIKYADKKSRQSILDNEVYSVLHNSIKKELSKYNEVLKALKDKISIKSEVIKKLNTVKKEQENLVSSTRKLKRERKRSLNILRKQHNFYVMKLEKLNKNQGKVKNSSIDFSIVTKNITRSDEKFEPKAISPLKKYTIISKFGPYYDSTYETELFNKSISLQRTTEDTQVYSIFDGEIAVIKRTDGRFKNIVIVKYDDGLNGIYSNLEKVSPNISVGMNVTKGFVLGKIDKILMFQTTRNNKYIDPEKFFK